MEQKCLSQVTFESRYCTVSQVSCIHFSPQKEIKTKQKGIERRIEVNKERQRKTLRQALTMLCTPGSTNPFLIPHVHKWWCVASVVMVTATRVTVIRVDGSQQRVNAHFPPFNHFAWLYCKYCVDETSLLYNPQSVSQFHERGLKREYLKRLTLYYTVKNLLDWRTYHTWFAQACLQLWLPHFSFMFIWFRQD